MGLPISRGRISHTVLAEVGWLARALVAPLRNEGRIAEAERAFAAYTDRRHCVTFPLARTAIWSVLKYLNLPPGSRVVLPPLTIKPILDVVVHLGLEPLYVDLDPRTACFDEEGLREAMKSSPRVAILTYLFGIVPEVDRLLEILRGNDVFVIEDFSQCLNGAFGGRKIGTFGDVSVYSASSVKTFDSFGGGYLVTDDTEIADRMRLAQSQLGPPKRSLLVRGILKNLVRNVASSRSIFAGVTYWAIQLLTRLSSGRADRFTGSRGTLPLAVLPRDWFRRYTSLQASVALRELPRTAARDARRVTHMESLIDLAGPLQRPSGSLHGRNVYWQFIVYVDDYDAARARLARHRVDCAVTSLSLLSGLERYPGRRETPCGRMIYERGLYIPCYHQLHDAEVSRIASAIRDTAR